MAKGTTVKDLIKALNEIEDKDRIVLISKDSEGNSFHAIDELSLAHCVEEGREYIIGLSELTPELEKLGYSEEDVLENGEKAIVIWPNN